jgi:uncharacterized protein
MRTLVLCDDRWHPAATARQGLAPLAEQGLVFDWIEHADEWSAERMAGYSAVLLTKSNENSATDHRPWMTLATQQAFRNFVRSGHGLLVVHSGSAGYAETPVLRGLLGGVFLSHPPQCAVTIEPRADHPLAVGSTPFTIKDEHYMMAFDDPDADVFMTTSSEHGTQPGGWTRAEGQGRVCLLSPGHNVEVWLHASYQQLLVNALRWCHGAVA